MDDLISRQAAIDALEKVAELFPWKVPGNRDTYDRYNEAWNDAIGRAEIEIEELPSAQPEQIWIPCSERLPEESGYYIITAHDGVGHRTTFVKYQKKAKSWDLTGARSYWRVIAWMPLPEPYMGADMRGEQDDSF